jgi:hypothetical protein
VRAAREQDDVGPGLGQPGADVAADGAGAGDDEPPSRPAAGVVLRDDARWILPVAVRGMASVMWIFFGRLKSASRSLQNASRSASDTTLSAPSAARPPPLPRPRWDAACRSTPPRPPTDGRAAPSSISRGEIFLAAAVDHLLQAPGQHQVAVLVETP